MTDYGYKDEFYEISGIEPEETLEAIENNQLTFKCNFSREDYPGSDSFDDYDVESFILWGDELTYVLRFCSSNYSGSFPSGTEYWPGILFGDADSIIIVYRNDTIDGWVLVTDDSDCLCAIKGKDVYTSIGSLLGIWNIGYNTHQHVVIQGESGATKEIWYDVDGNEQDVPYVTNNNGWGIPVETSITGKYGAHDVFYTDEEAANTMTSWRPEAAVCTKQRINI